jgi:dTMP kinase
VRKGKLIVFEGADGSGKTTQLQVAMQLLEQAVPNQWLISKEPGGTKLGDELRRLMFTDVGTGSMAPGVVDLLFLASHIQNAYEVVGPALDAGKIVLCDRWWYSQLVYMRERQVPPAIQQAYVDCKYRQADLVFFLYGKPETLFHRANNGVGREHQALKKWNNVETLARIQQNYQDVFLQHSDKSVRSPLHHVDTEDYSIQQVAEVVQSVLYQKLHEWKYLPSIPINRTARSYSFE